MERRLGETHRKSPFRDIVDERRERSRLPQERDEPGLALEMERGRNASDLAVASLVLGSGERDRRRFDHEQGIALAPALGNPANVLDETDGAYDRCRVDRAAVRLVVKRDVPGHDRKPERRARRSDPVDRFGQLPSDLRLLRIAEVETVGEAERLAAGARHVASRFEHGERPTEEGVEAGDPPLTVERKREPAQRRPQSEHRCVEPWPADGARAHELVVASIDELTAAKSRRGKQLEERVTRRGRIDDRTLRGRVARLASDLVTRALVRQEPRGDLADDLLVPECAQLTGRSDLADRGVIELPAP